MKYGFLGCGNMGGAIASRLSEGIKDIAVSDRSGKAKEKAKKLGLTYADNITVARDSEGTVSHCGEEAPVVIPYFLHHREPHVL